MKFIELTAVNEFNDTHNPPYKLKINASMISSLRSGTLYGRGRGVNSVVNFSDRTVEVQETVEQILQLIKEST